MQLCVLSSLTIISLRKRELVALLIASCLYVGLLVCRSSSWYQRLVWYLLLYQFIIILTHFLMACSDYLSWYVYLYKWSGSFCYTHFWIKDLLFPWFIQKHHGYFLSNLLTRVGHDRAHLFTPKSRGPGEGSKISFFSLFVMLSPPVPNSPNFDNLLAYINEACKSTFILHLTHPAAPGNGKKCLSFCIFVCYAISS